ncbi:corrinoid protein [Desulforhopalus singaporensis]|uniref:5-methyltetrahydrofolate--homocysteine methyltransferase n=1 Tax=Desulforhopalus singaporensis TaxID=91360 RepID=A0A1H0VZU2_9BACT|nr:corrinoid protein [Desulforhopalus singaporensis]SDP83656.1 5-methyltetrahydrofolate--homocysteine methyltransferase [Desulforhopalus singaporensis]
MADLSKVVEILLGGDKDKLIAEVQANLNGGADGKDILNEGLIKGMDIVGEKMESGDMFIPEVLNCAMNMSAAVEILKPHLPEESGSAKGKVVIGTVKGDLHDIGKNLVAMMMESAGMTVINLGVDIAPEQFVAKIKESGAQIVALSALLTTTMAMMKKTIDAISESGLRDQVKIMIGGAPVNQDFAEQIGADGYAPDAGSAARLAKELVA